MDPNTNTRKEFTTDLISNPIPGKADPEWKTNVERQKVLMEKLTHRPAMAPNLNQTYMMLANSKNKVYFEWDFVGRTFVIPGRLILHYALTHNSIRACCMA